MSDTTDDTRSSHSDESSEARRASEEFLSEIKNGSSEVYYSLSVLSIRRNGLREVKTHYAEDRFQIALQSPTSPPLEDPSNTESRQSLHSGIILRIHQSAILDPSWLPEKRSKSPGGSEYLPQTGPQSSHATRNHISSFEHAQYQFSETLPTKISLISTILLSKLRSLVQYYPEYQDHAFKKTLTIAEPFPLLMHHFEEIDALASNGTAQSPTGSTDDTTEREQRRQMAVLRDAITETYERQVLPCRRLLTSEDPMAYFDMLWYVFRPGEDVYVQAEEGIFGAVVLSVTTSILRSPPKKLSRVSKPGTHQSWDITVWYLAPEETRIARKRLSVELSRYHGMRELRLLPICPAAVWDKFDGGKRRLAIMKRNRLHFSAIRDGSLHATHSGSSLKPGLQYHGEVIIDHANGEPSLATGGLLPVAPPDLFQLPVDSSPRFIAYDHIYIGKRAKTTPGKSLTQQQPDIWAQLGSSSAAGNAFSPYPPPFGDESVDKSTNLSLRDLEAEKQVHATSEMNEHQLWLLHPRAPAFALATKQWIQISMDYVSEVKASDESMKNLVMDENQLQIVKSLSLRQDRKLKSWGADFIEGKGAGQIILLHGPPGVGKTYTVESMSAWLNRPLLALTVADIGTQETQVEQELMRWFDLAEAWNAILLVDEADIFLEQRKTRDLSRNSLVSAFLRRMEYFRGLLFLTTNRVGQIDDAFMSRVHLAISYDRLSHAARNRIWEGFFAKLAKERAGRVIVGRQAKKYVLESEEVQRIRMNGREIRNALQTAITLAEFETLEQRDGAEADEPVVVEESHFRRVLQMTEKFQTYVSSIRREDDEKRAWMRGDMPLSK